MIINYKVNENITIKEFIYKNISRNFYGYLKEHNVVFYINNVVKKNYEMLSLGDLLRIEYEEEKR